MQKISQNSNIKENDAVEGEYMDRDKKLEAVLLRRVASSSVES